MHGCDCVLICVCVVQPLQVAPADAEVGAFAYQQQQQRPQQQQQHSQPQQANTQPPPQLQVQRGAKQRSGVARPLFRRNPATVAPKPSSVWRQGEASGYTSPPRSQHLLSRSQGEQEIVCLLSLQHVASINHAF